MAFTDDFTGTTGQLLSARAGWSLAVGEDCFTVSSTGTLTKINSTTGSLNVYYRTDDASITPTVAGDFLSTSAPAAGLFVFGTGTSAATFSCYVLRPQTATGCRVYRMINGVLDASPVLNLTGLADTLQLELRASVTGGNAVLTVFSHGAQVGTFTDTTTAKMTSGRRGVLNNATASGVNALDNYSDNYAVAAALAITPRGNPLCEGVLARGAISYQGTYTGTVATIEGKLIDDTGATVSGQDWSTKVASPSGNAFTLPYSNLLPGIYRPVIRDSANPGVEVIGQEFVCGAVLPINDQSIHEKMATDGKTPNVGALTAAVPSRVFVLYPSTRLASTAAPVFTRLNALNAYGSGYMAMADQIAADWAAHIPIVFVDIAFSGCPMNQWINDELGAGSTWPLRTGYATTMFNWCDKRITALIRPVVVNPSGYTVAAAYDALIPLYDAILTNQPGGVGSYQVWVTPVQRASRPWSTSGLKALREGAFAVGSRGGRWRVLSPPAIDTRAAGDGEIHQATGASSEATSVDGVAHTQGNQLIGRYMGRGVVSLLQSLLAQTPIDRFGPRIASVDYTDATLSALAIKLDRQVKTPAGATVDLPQHWWTNDAFTTKAEMTGVLQSDQQTVICAKPGGVTWSLGTTRYDYCRDTPWDTTGGLNGGEIAVQAKLDLLLHDLSSFNSNRGMPVMPEIANGVPVALPIPIVATNATGTATLRVRQAA